MLSPASKNGGLIRAIQLQKGSSPAARVSALLDDNAGGKGFRRLFNIRSVYVHGRKMEDSIPLEERIAACRLSRKVVTGLAQAASNSRVRQGRQAAGLSVQGN